MPTDRTAKYLNVRIPRDIIADVDAARAAREAAGDPVPNAREPFLWWLLRQALKQEQNR